jgi:hypothetical protein
VQRERLLKNFIRDKPLINYYYSTSLETKWSRVLLEKKGHSLDMGSSIPGLEAFARDNPLLLLSCCVCSFGSLHLPPRPRCVPDRVTSSSIMSARSHPQCSHDLIRTAVISERTVAGFKRTSKRAHRLHPLANRCDHNMKKGCTKKEVINELCCLPSRLSVLCSASFGARSWCPLAISDASTPIRCCCREQRADVCCDHFDVFEGCYPQFGEL